MNRIKKIGCVFLLLGGTSFCFSIEQTSIEKESTSNTVDVRLLVEDAESNGSARLSQYGSTTLHIQEKHEEKRGWYCDKIAWHPCAAVASFAVVGGVFVWLVVHSAVYGDE